ncbi:alpha-tocopherol transfer protein-like [Neodiprion virginianus]|uniref:Alpha-tocopherol transfer protein-like n=1 Tax=Neodiprion lecontei TaxID=441921 RepID=A0A6J0BZD7_NEOLC|nr:alpha-tocopherol transfer protein-like [Neodiprion lecontei]XP_046416362.1 alpha-tocopherol transfer protein-like [Neodiprion fabricii]XP_046416363.1 alpha-tocopherol transfer protein-like [Neodiprion fabricii]XP_046590398.1 alpha-tocopherol transfer protein-like [Neodiprion lecontei]XP_046609999.1 alpha-tocopherol transfer protein-like [Neodiprion virginianus]XP_046610000.1 alpha-tocopherol transfer protein-like [Neodiprion virginianus]
MTLLPPTVKQQERIDQEMKWDPEQTRKDVANLREWLVKQRHLPQHIDDVRLERFLYGCKNSLERTKQMLDRYFTARTALPEFFAARDPLANDIQECCKAIQYFLLPSLTSEGYRVTILRLVDTRLEKFSLETITRRILMVMDTRLVEEFSLSNVMIIDLQGFNAGHISRCVPTQTVMRRGMVATQNSMPFRLARIHFLHTPSFIGNVLAMIYPLLKEKLVDKFRFHTGGGEELYSYMDKDILPAEWGGKAGTFDELNDAWKRKIEKNRDWFLREEKLCRTNENARLPNSKSSLTSELNGIQGSFRKLNID